MLMRIILIIEQSPGDYDYFLYGLVNGAILALKSQYGPVDSKFCYLLRLIYFPILMLYIENILETDQ